MHLSISTRGTSRVSAAAGLLLLFALGCGSETGGSTTSGDAGVDDGKYRPPGNGQHISETEACSQLRAAQQDRVAKLEGGCTATTRPCPDLIRSQIGGTACLEYDQGSVQGCVDHYMSKETCEELAIAIDECVVTAFSGTDPKGCPE